MRLHLQEEQVPAHGKEAKSKAKTALNNARNANRAIRDHRMN